MNAPLAKIGRDLFRQRWRGLLVVLAIGLGIAGFCTVLAAYAVLTRELDAGYFASSPASATFHLEEPVGPGLVADLLAGGDFRHAEARRRLAGQIRAGEGPWRQLRLFVADDYEAIAISRIESQAGSWPPAAGEILIERDAFQVLRARLGDRVRLRTGAGAEVELPIAGSVKDVGQAQARMENLVYGYVTRETLALLGEQDFLDQVLVLAAGDAFDEDHVRRVAARAEARLRAGGARIARVDIPPPGRHPHADLMNLLLRSMALFGLFVLLLAAVVVVNLMVALMAAQVRQVAVMKTLGGSRRQIAAIYFGQVLMLALAALAIGLPLGLWGGRALCRSMSVFLNFDISSYALPPWVYALVFLVGLVVPLLAAAWPIGRGIARPVLAGLADHGTSAAGPPAAFGAGAFDRWLAGFGGATRPLLLAVRNAFRRRTRLALTLLTTTTAGTFFLAALDVRASLIHTADRLYAGKTAAARYSFDQHMLMIYVFLILVSAILASLGGLALTTSMSLGVLERRREIGVLRAIGASPSAIRRIFMAEGAAIGLLGWLLSAAISLPVAQGAANLLGERLFRGPLDFRCDLQGLAIWLAVSLLLGLLASLLPAWRASRAPLRESLAYE